MLSPLNALNEKNNPEKGAELIGFEGGSAADALKASARAVSDKSALAEANPAYIYYVKSKRGFYQYDEAITQDRVNADESEIEYLKDGVNSGAWVRCNFSTEEKAAIYKLSSHGVDIESMNDYEKSEPTRAFKGMVNINSSSENLTDAHYAKDSGLTVKSDEMSYNGITLQRVSTPTFSSSVRDIRAADYKLIAGKRYLFSVYICAPFLQADSQGIQSDFNRFVWMRNIANATTYGHGAKLIGSKPRRIWHLFEAASDTELKSVQDPSISLSTSTPETSVARFLFDGFGLGGSISGKDVYIGGMQIEEAKNQTEKSGIALIGTSIDTSTSSLKHPTQERSWPRYLEGLLNVPVFNAAIGGQNSTQLVARFDNDVAIWGENSKYCILAANVNDFSAGFDSLLYRANWLSMYNKAIAAGMIPIFITPARRSIYDYQNGAADMEQEIQYIKDTYPFVIDRDKAWQDPFNKNLLRADLETDGIHPVQSRDLAFMIFNEYRHFFEFDNKPSEYQKNEFDNSKVQSHGLPVWLNRIKAARTSSTVNSVFRDSEEGSAPMIIFEAALSGATVYQLPCANYQKPNERVNTDIQVQVIRNATTGGHNVSVQYYKRDESNGLAAAGVNIGPIPAGESWTIACDGDTAWRVQ